VYKEEFAMDSWFMRKGDGIKSKTGIPYQAGGANRDPNDSVSWGHPLTVGWVYR